jgi:biotin synthase
LNRWGALTRIHFGDWRAVLADGEAFRTAGCPACNRPFYNERPGGTMYNYARELTADEAAQALQEAELEV